MVRLLDPRTFGLLNVRFPPEAESSDFGSEVKKRMKSVKFLGG